MSFDMGYHEYAREKYKERVAKTPQRAEYAMKRLTENNIKHELKHEGTGHFHAWSEAGKLLEFWASTGKIKGHNKARGIEAVVRILKRGK